MDRKPKVLISTSKWFRHSSSTKKGSFIPYPHVSYLVDTLNASSLAQVEPFFFDEIQSTNPNVDFATCLFDRFLEVKPEIIMFESFQLGLLSERKQYGIRINEIEIYKEFLKKFFKFPVSFIIYWTDIEENLRDVAKLLEPYVSYHNVWDVGTSGNFNEKYIFTPAPINNEIYKNNGLRYPDRTFDLCFIGNVKGIPDRMKILTDLQNLNINHKILADGLWNGPSSYISDELCADVYNNSKIAVNFSLNPLGKHQVKARVFETILCGCLLFEQENNETMVYFEPYEDYIPWKDEADLLEKMQFFLFYKGDEAEKIASNGCKKANSLYTGDTYWRKIFQYHNKTNQIKKSFLFKTKRFLFNYSSLSDWKDCIYLTKERLRHYKRLYNTARVIYKVLKVFRPLSPILKKEGYYGFNIISYGDKFYGLAQSEGAFSINKVGNNGYEKLFIGDSIEEVEKLIINKIAPATCNAMPTFLIISTAVGCNLKCKMCYLQGEVNDSLVSDIVSNKGKLSMPDIVFGKTLGLVSQSDMLLITVEGEILIFPEWFNRWVRVARLYKKRIGFQTNGMALNHSVIEQILTMPEVVHIGVSLDGATPGTNDNIRIKSSFEKITRNISILIEERNNRGLKNPGIEVHFVMMRENIHELPVFVEKIFNLGVNSISFSHLIARRREDIKEALFFDQERSDYFVLEAKKIAEKIGKAYNVSFPHTFSHANKDGITHRSVCLDPWKHGQILYDGSVYSCCNNSIKMGNILEEGGFEKVWNNEKYRYLRKVINSDNPVFTACKYCYAYLPVNNFEAFIDTKLLFKLLGEGESVLQKWCPRPVKLLVKPGEQYFE